MDRMAASCPALRAVAAQEVLMVADGLGGLVHGR